MSKGNYRDFFKLLGITKKIEIIRTPVRYKTVVIPEISFLFYDYYSNEYKKVFDKIIQTVLVGSSPVGKQQKIFLSRSRFSKANASENGLEMLDNFFKKNGYRILHPETLSLRELILQLHSAEEIACCSGSIAHNVVFGYSHQKLTIIERQCVVNPVQNAFDKLMNLSVTYIDGHHAIYPVTLGGGPYIFAFNRYMKEFARERSYVYPDSQYICDHYQKRCLAKYFHTYKKWYYLSCGADDWHLPYSANVYQAYLDTYEDVKEYLLGERAYCWKQYFELRILKNVFKRLLRF